MFALIPFTEQIMSDFTFGSNEISFTTFIFDPIPISDM